MLENQAPNPPNNQNPPFQDFDDLDILALEDELGIKILEFSLELHEPYILFLTRDGQKGAVIADTWRFRCVQATDTLLPPIEDEIFQALQQALRTACCLAY